MRVISLKWNDGCIRGLDCMEKIEDDTAVTVGNFDGVHLGHRSLLKSLVDNASKKGFKSLVLSFYPHPLKVLSPKQCPCELTTLEEKTELLSSLGLDYAVFLKFDLGFSLMRADDFVREILFRRLKAKFLLVGYDWRFGYKREGEIELARELGEELGFEVALSEPFKVKDHIASSTLIRRLLHSGRLGEAEEYLGRRYWVKRKVVRGDGRGSSIGIPTANLDGTENLCLKEGVYTVLVDNSLLGVANYGYRPTFDGRKKVLEVHIIGFKGDLKGKRIKVEFLRFLREERRFSSLTELKRQIEEDIRLTKSSLNKREPTH